MFTSDLTLGLHRSTVERAERELAIRRSIAERAEREQEAERAVARHLLPRLAAR
ncbi:hypothetical protein [Agromyces archimandritae]|uniref:Uncharacterized protein n=1 Tax=Agromyces archimandritae TaxID=2781962 RepID=A0A975IPS5_9MICO|nr:hypothetical protein [Agromyces archimandritae]QTX05948.1 hypothetical protein G127AT_07105 [Agromyces archimandritae]